jgi:MarR family transcriptional regulator, organic hydroperoxide resistance regulator
MVDYTRKYGPAAIGARLRRLSESIDEDAGRIYVDLGFDFQQRWVGILEQLHDRGAQSVGELTKSLGIRHSSVSQTRRSLEEARLVESDVDPEDGRSRLLRLSVSGEELVRRLQPLWKVLNATSLELDQEADQVIEALDRLDRALERLSLYDRVKQKLASRKPR